MLILLAQETTKVVIPEPLTNVVHQLTMWICIAAVTVPVILLIILIATGKLTNLLDSFRGEQSSESDQISETGHHQGAVAFVAAYNYAEIDDLFAKSEEKGESPFFIILDEIEDPHNLGAIIRTANLAGAHGVIVPKNRACGLTATVVKASAGAINYTPIVKVTNIAQTIESLKERGMWFVCADMDGETMYDIDLKGSIGLVIGNEGKGVSRLVKEKCDFVARIPMNGDIDSLNASVATGVLAFEIVRQRMK